MQLAVVLQEETDDHILAVTVWAIGQIGKHTPEHAKAVAVANLLSKLLEVYRHILFHRSFFLKFPNVSRLQFR